MSLQATLLQNIRTKYAGTLDKYEDRLSEYGAWGTFVRDTNDIDSIVTPEIIESARGSIGNTLQIPVIDGGDITITNARTCTISDFENSSALVTVTFVTYQWGFTMVPAQYANNEIAYQQDLERKMIKAGKSLAQTLDTSAVAKLEADKTQIMNSALIGVGAKYGALVGDAIQVSSANTNFFFNDASTIMMEDDFSGRYNVIGSQSLRSIVNLYVNQGNANSQNSEFQFGAFDFGYSNRVSVDTAGGKNSTSYVMPKGTLATFNRNTPDALAGTMINENNWYDIVRFPVVDLDVALHYQRNCADNSGVAGGGQAYLSDSVKEQWIFSTDVAFVTAYNRDAVTLAGPIHKAEFAN